MAPVAVKAWKQVLVLLEHQHAQAQSQQTDSPAACQVSNEIGTLYVELFGLEMVPRAAWKKIINDMEVRRSAERPRCSMPAQQLL